MQPSKKIHYETTLYTRCRMKCSHFEAQNRRQPSLASTFASLFPPYLCLPMHAVPTQAPWRYHLPLDAISCSMCTALQEGRSLGQLASPFGWDGRHQAHDHSAKGT